MSTDPPPTILCTGGGKVLVTQDRLQRLYDELPALQYILEGHPSFKKTGASAEDTNMLTANNVREVTLHADFAVSHEDLLALLGFFSRAEQSPETIEGWNRLHRVCLVLGGSSTVDEAFKEILKKVGPSHPMTDTNDNFLWRSIVPRQMSRQQALHRTMEIEDEGYYLVSAEEGVHCFRKRRRQN